MPVCVTSVALCLLLFRCSRRSDEQLQVVIDFHHRPGQRLPKERIDLVDLGEWFSTTAINASKLDTNDLRHLVEQAVHLWPRSDDSQTEEAFFCEVTVSDNGDCCSRAEVVAFKLAHCVATDVELLVGRTRREIER